MSERIETPYHKLIGLKDGTWYFLDNTFQYSGEFKGAVGTRIEFLTQDQFDCRVKNYDREDLWRMAVQAGNTTMGLDSWQEEAECDADILIDQSYSYTEWVEEAMKIASEYDKEEYVYSDCTGGGRCFDLEMTEPDYWDYLVNPELLEIIKQYETT